MCDENTFYQELTSHFVLGPSEYEDPNRLYPMVGDQRQQMRRCRRCGVLHDINAPVGKCAFHKSYFKETLIAIVIVTVHLLFFKVTFPETGIGLVVGRGGSNLKEIQRVSNVTTLTVAKKTSGRFKGEIELQGGEREIRTALSMIREKLRSLAGRVDGSWECCKQAIGGKNCDEEKNHDSLISQCFRDQSLVVATKNLTGRNDPSGAPKPKVFALDCDMVNTTRGKELARVTLLNFKGETSYETLVRPTVTILDYNTKYSGITEEMLQGVTTSLKDVQERLVEQFSANDIIIDNDLRCLHLEHRKVRQ